MLKNDYHNNRSNETIIYRNGINSKKENKMNKFTIVVFLTLFAIAPNLMAVTTDGLVGAWLFVTEQIQLSQIHPETV